MASVEPGASAAIWRSVAAIASLVRYKLTPVEATTAGRPVSKPAAISWFHQHPPASKSTGTSRSHSGMPKPSSTSRRRFQAWGPGWSTSNMRRPEAIPGRRWAKVSRPAPRMTYWLTPWPACSTTRSSMKRALATVDARERLVASRSMSGRWRQPSSGATSRRPISSSSTCGGASTRRCMARHNATRTAELSAGTGVQRLAGAWTRQIRPSGSRTVISLVP
jgi:hypothetical protein